jgi:amino acid transporter
LVAISSFVVRWKNPRLEKPYRIPFGPVAPAIALIGAIAALTQQTSKDLITVGFIALAALIYYLVYLRGKENRISANPSKEWKQEHKGS